jgi:hypothetical protein
MDVLFDQSIKTSKTKIETFLEKLELEIGGFTFTKYFYSPLYVKKNLKTVQFIQVRKVEEAVTGEDSV